MGEWAWIVLTRGPEDQRGWGFEDDTAFRVAFEGGQVRAVKARGLSAIDPDTVAVAVYSSAGRNRNNSADIKSFFHRIDASKQSRVRVLAHVYQGLDPKTMDEWRKVLQDYWTQATVLATRDLANYSWGNSTVGPNAKVREAAEMMREALVPFADAASLQENWLATLRATLQEAWDGLAGIARTRDRLATAELTLVHLLERTAEPDFDPGSPGQDVKDWRREIDELTRDLRTGAF